MKTNWLCVPGFLLLVSGCAWNHPRGVAGIDPFESVAVSQMTGNNISASPLSRTVFCLNARCETRRFTSVTNSQVSWSTNLLVGSVTNRTESYATNSLLSQSTNQLPPIAAITLPSTNSEAPAAAEAPNATPLVNTAQSRSGDISVSRGTAGNQAVVSQTTQSALSFNEQVTENLTNFSISSLSNLVVRTEILETITTTTNPVVTATTNTVIIPTNGVIHDHYLVTELTPPSDFTLASGESLVVLADGVRYGFSPASSMVEPRVRAGFQVTQYKASAEALVAIANAREVRVRLRGTTLNSERQMSSGARKNFRKFLVRFYTP